jgi:hypothetical protein
VAIIETTNGVRFIVDDSRYKWLSQFVWIAAKRRRAYYAMTLIGPPENQKRAWMHRIVARTPLGMVCHHKNQDSQDNRLENLENLSPKTHDGLHRNNGIIVQFDPERKMAYSGMDKPKKISHNQTSNASGNPVV